MFNNNLNSEARSIASSDDTPAEVLQELSADPDPGVRLAVASNPNTPVKILEKLGKEFPEAITANPIFNILLLENPDGRFVQLSLARSSTTSEEILIRLATIPHKNKRSNSYRSSLADHFLSLSDHETEILLAIANNTSTPQEILVSLLSEIGSELYGIQEAEIDHYANGACWMVGDPTDYPEKPIYEKIILAICSNINTPIYAILSTPMIRAIERIQFDLLDMLARNPSTTSQILEELTNSDIRAALARNRNVSLQILEKLANDKSVDVRRAVAGNPNASLQILEKLASDYYEVRTAVADNPNTSLQILEKLVSDDYKSVRAAVARNSNTSLQILEKLASDYYGEVRRAVAENPNTSLQVLEKLAGDRGSYVKQTAQRYLDAKLKASQQ